MRVAEDQAGRAQRLAALQRLEDFIFREPGLQRGRLEVPHYLSLPAIIEGSGLIATVPRDVGVAFVRIAKLRLLEPPVNVSFDVKQYWHERAHKDPVNLWLRDMVHSLFHD